MPGGAKTFSAPTVLISALGALLVTGIAISAALQGPLELEERGSSAPVGTPNVDTPPLPQLPVETAAPPAEPTGGGWLGVAVFITMLVLAAAALTFMIIVLVRIARTPRKRGALGHTSTRLGAGAGTGPGALDADQVRSHVDSALAALDSAVAPGDAITAAWVQLEQGAAALGVERALSQTPGEFAVGLFSRGHAAAVSSLLRMYEDVRYGGWQPDEHDRQRARATLQEVLTAWE